MCGMCVATKNRLSKIMNPWDTLIVRNAKFEGAGALLYYMLNYSSISCAPHCHIMHAPAE